MCVSLLTFIFSSFDVGKYVKTKKINDEGGLINPKKGISAFLKMEGRGGIKINSRSLPCRWQSMLHCQAGGEAAKGLITGQSPHVPESLTTR
jgi:hypothetical protein